MPDKDPMFEENKNEIIPEGGATNEESGNQTDNTGSESTGSQTGTNTGAKNGKGKRPGGNRKKKETPTMESGTGLNVTIKQFESSNSQEAKPGEGSGLDAKEAKQLARLEAIGRAKIVDADISGVNLDGSVFEYIDNTLASHLDSYNSVMSHDHDTGNMHQIDKIQEVMFIPNKFAADESPIQYLSNVTIGYEGEKAIPTLDPDAEPIKGGQFMGVNLRIRGDEITGIDLIDMTNADVTDATSARFGAEEVRTKSAHHAHYINREAKVAYELMSKNEEKKDGVSKNVIYRAPASQEILITLMDINRETTHIVERAYDCACKFMSSIAHDKYLYGKDQNNRGDFLLAKVRPILDMSQDGKKIKRAYQLLSSPFLDNHVFSNVDTFFKYPYLYCNPKLSIAIKKELQKKMKWSKISNDHRSVRTRHVLAGSFTFPYSDVTTINGVKLETGGVGGNAVHEYLAMNGNNPEVTSIVHPVFDGIHKALSKYTETIKLSTHAWGHNYDKSKGEWTKDTYIPLTFDPEYPLFSFLVLWALPEILGELKDMMVDLETYINEGGPTPGTFVKYNFENLKSYLKDSGYSRDNWMNVTKDIIVEKDEGYGDLRIRFPEVFVRMISSGDLANQAEYYPGIFSRYSFTNNDGELRYTYQLQLPAGRNSITGEKFISELDPVLYVIDNSYRTSNLKLTPVGTGVGKVISTFASAYDISGITLATWCKARRVNGIYYAIPTCLTYFDPNTHYYDNDGSITNPMSPDDIKKLLAIKLNATKIEDVSGQPGITNGIQICSYRMEFAIPMNDSSSAHIVITNRIGDEKAQNDALCTALLRGKYYQEKSSKAEFYAKYDTKTKTYSSSLGLSQLVMFPFCVADVIKHKLPYEQNDMWSYHASFIRLYSNPFLRIFESVTEAAEVEVKTEASNKDNTSKTTTQDEVEVVSNAAGIRMIPHLVSLNHIFYWVPLNVKTAYNKMFSIMESDEDRIEYDLFKIKD